MCQQQYCLNMLHEAGVLGCKSASTPFEAGTHLYNDAGPIYEDITGYRKLVGKLLYLTNTRPNICFPIQQLSQFLDKPTMQHFRAAQRVLRYLKSCPGKGVFFPRSSSFQLLGFSDADWGGCPDSRQY